MIVQGSMRYSPSGRKRNTDAWKKARKPDFQASSKTISSKTPEIPSSKTTSYKPMENTDYRVEESKKFTVAPAYNKGAYQVIPRGEVKWIGK